MIENELVMEEIQLIRIATEARARAHAPYSNFAVGAALLTRSGRVFRGCNIENVSFRLTMCAEQAAVSAAIAEGEKDFVEIAVVADSKEPIVPCGACRQVLAEFSPEMKIVMANLDGLSQTVALSELLPRPRQGILESTRNV
jgi:cytidine deaminase